MILPQDSTPTPGTLRPSSTEQDIIYEIQLEQLTLVRVAADEATESWQKTPIRLSDWSNTLETEIYRSLL